MNLAGVPGLLLADVQPTSLAPDGTTTLNLTVQSADLAPGAYEASLIVAVRDGVDMARRELPLRLNVYQPALALEDAEFDLGAIRADRMAGERRVQFTISSTSLLVSILSWA